ncbi:MAG: BolA/IbaG family iron-sulfur metabolism protein [Gammaproteobacteria bacterium]|nr:BolA/IbaG family iron-sulfur metabolism protein [Gammaproteobacteria bacterium]MCP4979790.1 BolA/IbaG family iron-sulfur metabolism protein [Gammaproteobacteria bacterium]
MSIQAAIEQKLASEYHIDYLQVENESHMHNVAAGSESHFKVTIVSDSFNDQMLIKRHRMVNKTLQQEMQQIHALSLHTLTPDEWKARAGTVANSPKCRGGGKNQ